MSLSSAAERVADLLLSLVDPAATGTQPSVELPAGKAVLGLSPWNWPNVDSVRPYGANRT